MKTGYVALGVAAMGIAYFVMKNKGKSAGGCRPADEATRSMFRSLQQKANILLAQRNVSMRIKDTGEIDAATIKAVNLLLGSNFTDCATLAARAGVLKKSLDIAVRGQALLS